MNAFKSVQELQKLATLLGGMPIIGILEDSPAGRMGLRYGDILTHIGPHPVVDVGSFVRARERYKVELPLTVVRDGTELLITLDLGGDQTSELD